MSARVFVESGGGSARLPAPFPLSAERIAVVGHPLCRHLVPVVPTGTVAAVTPVYLGNAELRQCTRWLDGLRDRNHLVAVFLRDLGLLTHLRSAFPDVERIWDRWAWGREGIVSSATLDTLRDLGAQSIEIDSLRADASLLNGLEARKMRGVAALSGRPASFSPRCYTEHLRGEVCDGRLLCRQGPIDVVVMGRAHHATGHALTADDPPRSPPPGWDLSW